MPLLLLLILLPVAALTQDVDYLDYHHQIIRGEKAIVEREFEASLNIYRQLAETYEFAFLRDVKNAVQLSAYINDTTNLYFFLQIGMRKGWSINQIKRIPGYRKFRHSERWRNLKAHRNQFEADFNTGINRELRAEMKKMLAQDQRRALRVALTPGNKWRERYTNQKFVPNNRKQVRRINEIIDRHGFPGEKVIGDRSWATVIISHNEHDTIYKELRPKLYTALRRGELAPIELAMIETWRTVIDTERKEKGFLIWSETVSQLDAKKADSLRQTIGLRSVELNNQLIQTGEDLKMEFYLTPFHGGIIYIKD